MLQNAQITFAPVPLRMLAVLSAADPSIKSTNLNGFPPIAVSKGTVAFDKDNKKIVASKVDLDQNEDYKITYNLQIKSVVDSTKVNLDLRTSKQVNITLNNLGTDINGNFPATDRIDDDICSPVIQILKEAVDNPYTGVYSYVIAGSCMLAVALITLAVLNKKKYEL